MKLLITTIALFTMTLAHGQCSSDLIIQGNPLNPVIKFADLDLDGDQDIVFCGNLTRRILLFENDGVGNFSLTDTLLVIPDSWTTPSDITLEDLDSDNDLDIIINFFQDTSRVFRNDGVYLFTQVNTLPNVLCRATGDINNDNVPDFLSALSFIGDFRRNDGNFLFTNMGASFPGRNAIITDVNGDGWNDIMSGYYRQLFVNINDGNFSGNPVPQSQGIYYGTASSSSGNTQLIDIDYDLDNDIDAVVLNSYTDDIQLFTNDGNGVFTASPLYSAAPGNGVFHLNKADVNNDGVDDITFTKFTTSAFTLEQGEILCMFGTGTSFAAPATIYTGDFGRWQVFEDIQGNGYPELFTYRDSIFSSVQDPLEYLDVFSYNTTSYSNINHIFAFDDLWSIWGFPGSFGDFDLDGDVDIYSWPYQHFNEGNGNYTGILIDSSNNSDENDHLLYDFNGDNFIDLLYCNDNGVFLRVNNGGVFSTPITLCNQFADIQNVELLDFDNDGDPDVIFSFDDVGDYKIGGITNNGGLNFSNPFPLFGTQYFFLNLYGINDLDAPDTATTTNNISWAIVTQSGSVYAQLVGTSTPVLISSSSSSRVLIMDVDMDGLYDVITNGNQVRWHRNNGNGTFTSYEISSGLSIGQEIVLGDVDGDNLNDIVGLTSFPGGSSYTFIKFLGNGNFAPPVYGFIDPLLAGDAFVEIYDIDMDGLNEVLYNDELDVDRLKANDAYATFTSNYTSIDTAVICGGIPYVWSENGVSYSQPGYHLIHYTSIFGCDSIVALKLESAASFHDTLSIVECSSYTWNQNGTVYTTNTFDSVQYVGINGCDSNYYLNLTINTVNSSVTQLNYTTLQATASGAQYQWLDCSGNYSVINGETNQTYYATANGNYAVQITENGCIDTSACLSITTVGIFESAISGLLVSPNPTDGQIEILLGEKYSTVAFNVYNIAGRIVQSGNFENISKASVFIKQPSGIYTLEILADTKRAVTRIIKQ